jgi:hypothetical protein
MRGGRRVGLAVRKQLVVVDDGHRLVDATITLIGVLHPTLNVQDEQSGLSYHRSPRAPGIGVGGSWEGGTI